VTDYNCTMGSIARRGYKWHHYWIQNSLSSEQRSSADYCRCWWQSGPVYPR